MRERSGETETEIKMESAESFESDIIKLTEAETVKSISEPKRDRDFLTEEQEEMFVLDSSAEKKLMGVLDNNVEMLSVAAFKKYILDNSEDFGMEKEYVDNLSEEQVRNIMEGDRDKAIDVASRDPRYVEAIHLREMLREAKGNLNCDEKLVLFKRIDGRMIKNSVLLQELREKLWEAMEGEKIDDRVMQMMQKDGFYRKREGQAKKESECYRTAELIKALEVERSQIFERVDLEYAECRQITNFRAERLIIKEKIEEIKKKTGWDLSEENIVALFREGYDLVRLDPCENISGRLFKGFRKFKIDGKEVSLKELQSVSQKKSPAVVEEINSYMKKGGENWDSKFKETRERIIEDLLKEIPRESVERVYEKYKKIRFINEEFELEIKQNIKNRQTYPEVALEGRGELVKGVGDLYNYCKSVKDFEDIIGELHDQQLKDFIMNKNLSELNKERKGRKLSWYETFFDLTAEFLLSQKNLKRIIQEMIKIDKSIISDDLMRPLIKRVSLNEGQKEEILGKLHYMGEDARIRLLGVIKDVFIIEKRKNDAIRKVEKL